MTFAPGTLVRARGREWVVLPGATEDLLIVRPLGGGDEESTGILTSLERVEAADFAPPDPTDIGDFASCQLLRDALRLSFRSSAGPFRSFGQIAVDPRPYQLVPLLMGLRQDRVRLLIADDVGVGKTVEACLVAKELLAQGDAQRLAVLCPPHLAEQWQRELRDKFLIEAELVLPSTVRRLERGLPYGRSVFEAHPFVVVSIDFIKGSRYRSEFLRTCPELLIVDEAHGCTLGAERGKQLRHELVSKLAEDEARHLILVSATPHSGNEQAFRSLLGLLEPSLAGLPEDLAGRENETNRRRLARYLVQRRRADIEHYLKTDTPFPKRQEREETYALSPEYKRLFERVLAYAREHARDPEGGQHRQRVRWWSALALLRSLASSPAAAAATLRNRAAPADTESPEEADEVGRRAVMDLADLEDLEGIDVPPGADEEPETSDSKDRRRLLEMAREADRLCGELDHKLQKVIPLVKEIVDDGFHPIVFCRFIDTAEYVAEALRAKLRGVEVMAVTGRLPAEERELRVEELGRHERRVLVATDCLSEGINLQEHFDAVVHYDLSWNPTRHEQRDGRVDRFGQRRVEVRTLLYYGIDNQIDGIVLDVLIRKSKAIRRRLGVFVPVPDDPESVMEAIFEGLLLREEAGGLTQERLPGLEEFIKPTRESLHDRWDKAADREQRSRTLFAQETMKPDEVARELADARRAVGSGADVARFFTQALQRSGAAIQGDGVKRIDLTATDRAVRNAIGLDGTVEVNFDPGVKEGLPLTRTSPPVEGLATYVLDTALDAGPGAIAKRCGAIRTTSVERRTTLLLLRFRFDVITRRGTVERALLAEDWGLLGFAGAPDEPDWLDPPSAATLMDAEPTGNVTPAQASDLVARVIQHLSSLMPAIDEEAHRRAEKLRESHERVRSAARAAGATEVQPKLPADVLGVYILLPQPKEA